MSITTEGFSQEITTGAGGLVIPQVKSPNYVPGISGWAIFRNGTVEFNSGTFRGTVTAGTFQGADFIINPTGAFFYSGVPANGNLIGTAFVNAPGTDSFGNAYVAGFTSYDPVLGTFIQMFNGSMVTGLLSAAPGGLLPEIGLSGTNDALVLESGQQGGPFMNAVDLTLQPRDGSLGFVGGLATFNGSVEIDDNEAAGRILTVRNNTATPSEAGLLYLASAAADRCVGMRAVGDTFNRWLFTTDAVKAGSGAATQDTAMFRSAVGQWAADDILNNVGGLAETWHSLGTLPGATVNYAKYRLDNNGFARVQIDVTFGVATAASTLTFSNTMSAAYRPLAADVDIRRPLAQNNAGGVIARIFVGQAGGAAPGQVQIAPLGAGNYLGTYSGEASWPLI
jgi:hypothetical protein